MAYRRTYIIIILWSITLYILCIRIPYIQKYWRSLNLAIYINCLKSGSNALLAEFKFGILLLYVIAYIIVRNFDEY